MKLSTGIPYAARLLYYYYSKNNPTQQVIQIKIQDIGGYRNPVLAQTLPPHFLLCRIRSRESFKIGMFGFNQNMVSCSKKKTYCTTSTEIKTQATICYYLPSENNHLTQVLEKFTYYVANPNGALTGVNPYG